MHVDFDYNFHIFFILFIYFLYFSRKVPLRLKEISSSRESWPRWPHYKSHTNTQHM